MATPTIFTAGLDPTGFTQITGAQLKQLVASAQFAAGFGGVIVTVDSGTVPVLPDTTDYPTYENFIWLRIATTYATVVLYTWNPNATYLLSYTGGNVTTNWTPAFTGAIPPQSILGSQIANGTITATQVNIANLLSAMGLTPTSYITTATTPTGGQIGGSFGAGLTLNNNTVTSAEIAIDGVNGIQTANINAKQITAAKVLGGTINQVLATTDNANTVGWINLNTIQSIRQRKFILSGSDEGGNAGGTTAATWGQTGTTPGGAKQSTNIAVTNFVPLSTTNYILVKFHGLITNGTADNNVLGIFIDTSGNAFANYTTGTAATISYLTTTYAGNSTGQIIPEMAYQITNQATRLDVAIKFSAGTYTPTLKANSWLEIFEYSL